MLLSLNWLREFVPYTGTAEELADRLTMLGLELEEIRHPYKEINDILVGRVLTCEMHPDSDHLHVCTVDLGGEDPVGIVCGAANVAAGQLVPVAPVGCTMPGGFEIKKAKLRGVPSHGMICSERELGLTEDHSGILVLPETDSKGNALKPGTKLVDALAFDTEVLDISITPNRADCLSVLGLAREVAAAFDLPLTMPSLSIKEEGADCSHDVAIEIRDEEFCPCYMGRILEGVRVEPSPYWLRYRLHAVGVRPVSNLVDVTNYVMLELGQPLHAFDAGKLAGSRIIVQRASDGQKFTTLDHQERTLQANDGLICDAENAVALAGVMGGLATEVSDETKSIFLECALFQPASIRRTARRLGLSSEASYRYERGVDQTCMELARDRAASLMQQLGGGLIRKGVCKSEPRPFAAPRIIFRPSRPEALLGVAVSPEFCEKVLTSLHCAIVEKKDDCWIVEAPGARYDLTREADLVEEVARFYGVDSLPETLPRLSQNLDSFGQPEGRFAFLMRLKHFLAGLGLNEAINYSFVGNKDLDALNLPAEGRVNIINPLTADQDVLRTELAPGMLQNLRTNIAHGANGLRLFEIAQSFHQDASSETTVREACHLGLLVYGSRYDSAWPHSEEDADYTDLRGFTDHFFTAFLHLPVPVLVKLENHPFLMPAVQIRLEDGSADGIIVGHMGRIRTDIADDYYARKPVWFADILLDHLQELSSGIVPHFQALPVFPPVRRDITVICPASIPVGDVEKELLSVKCPLLQDVELRDIYAPKDSAERNLTFRLTFHADRTLQDAEVDKEREKITAAITSSLGVRV